MPRAQHAFYLQSPEIEPATDTKTAIRNFAPKNPKKLKRRQHHALATVPRRLVGSHQLGKSRSAPHSNTAITSSLKDDGPVKLRARPPKRFS